MKRAMRNKRREIIEDKPKPSAKEKFFKGLEDIETMQQQAVPKFVPATPNQKLAVSLLRGGCRVLFMEGSAGCGKSMLAAWWAAELLKGKKIESIFLVRPNVITGKTAGSLPGTEFEKLQPFFAQMLIHLEKFLGKGYLHYALEKEEITLKSAEYMRGRSLEDACVILDEAQNFTSNDMEMMLTRLGRNSTFIFCGDSKQNDLRGASGLSATIDLLDSMLDKQPDYLLDEDLESLDNEVASVRFTPEDCVRDGLTRAFVKVYYNA